MDAFGAAAAASACASRSQRRASSHTSAVTCSSSCSAWHKFCHHPPRVALPAPCSARMPPRPSHSPCLAIRSRRVEPNTLCAMCVSCGRMVHGTIDFTDVMRPNDTGYSPVNLVLLTNAGARHMPPQHHHRVVSDHRVLLPTRESAQGPHRLQVPALHLPGRLRQRSAWPAAGATTALCA